MTKKKENSILIKLTSFITEPSCICVEYSEPILSANSKATKNSNSNKIKQKGITEMLPITRKVIKV